MNNGIIIIIGERGSGKTTTAEKIEKKFYGMFKKSVGTTTRKKRENEIDGIHYNFVKKEDLADNVGSFIEINEFNGDFYGTLASELNRTDGKTPILILEAKGAAEVVDYCKKNGDSPFVVLMEQLDTNNKDLLPERGESIDGVEKRAVADSKMMKELKNLNITPKMIVDTRVDNIADHIVAEYNFFIQRASASPQFVALRESLKQKNSESKAYKAMNSSLSRAEVKKKNHIYGIAAAAMVVASTAGVWPAVVLSSFLYGLSKVREEHLEKNWFIEAEKFSAKESLLFAIFSGLSPDFCRENIKSKSDLEGAIKKFKLINSENKYDANVIEKSINSIGNKISELSVMMEGMQAIKAHYTANIKNGKGLSSGAVPEIVIQKEKDDITEIFSRNSSFTPPAETEAIYRYVNFKI